MNTHKHIIPHDYVPNLEAKIFGLVSNLVEVNPVIIPRMAVIHWGNFKFPYTSKPITAILSPEEYEVGDIITLYVNECTCILPSTDKHNNCFKCENNTEKQLTPSLEIKGKEVVEITHNYFSMVTVNGNIVKSESEEESFIHSIGFESISQFFTRYNESTTINLYKLK